VKLAYQPEGELSGWIPLKSVAAGNGWGVVFAPAIGGQVQTEFLEGSHDTGSASLHLYSDQDLPPQAPAGEWWFVHPSGSLLKFHNNGTIEITAPHGILITGEVAITGSLDVSGNVTTGTGVSGAFTSPEGQTVTVQDGTATNIF
jgi:phage baseplate assembly protein gpV